MSWSLERLIKRNPGNAVRCWGLLGVVLLAITYDLWSGGYVNAVLGIGVLLALLGPSLAYRSPRVMLPWEVVFVAAVALVVREILPWQPAESMGNYVVIAAIALILAVQVHVYTRVTMNRTFAMVFVAMVTMTVATAWNLGRWTLDVAIGTSFLPSNEALMHELIVATVVGVGMGELFVRYLKRHQPEEDRTTGSVSSDERRPGSRDSPTHRERRTPSLGERLPVSEQHQRRLVHLFQLVLGGVAIFGILTFDVTLTVTAGGALAVTFLPGILRRDYRVPLGVGLTLWLTTTVVLHSLGTLYFYGDFLWWHNLTHAVSGSLIAGIGYAVFRAIDEHTTAIRFPQPFMIVFILLFVISIGVLWEIFEFVTDRIVIGIGGEELVLAQHGLADTMTDMVFNVIGALIVALWGTAYLTGFAAGLREQLDGRR